jgi:hypothetical protein
MIIALAAITQDTLWEETKEKFNDAAWAVLGWESFPADVPGFADYWSKNAYYDGKPWLKTVLDHWNDYKDGRVLKRGKNGRHPPPPEEIYAPGIPETDTGGAF